MFKRVRFILFVFLIVFINIGCDQKTKEIAKKQIRDKGTINIAGDYVVLRYAENRGAFLGMFSNLKQPYKNILLIFLPILVMITFFVYLLNNKSLTIFQVICISSILGGGISNLYDRIVFNGYVTDFLNFGIGNFRTGILNFADISITFGAILLAYDQFKSGDLEQENLLQ